MGETFDEYANYHAGEIPDCVRHRWVLVSVTGPPWDKHCHWWCPRCDTVNVARSSRTPLNYPYVDPCERLSVDIDALNNISKSWDLTKRLIMNADLIARSIWGKLADERRVEQNLHGMEETTILALADRLLDLKCGVTRHICLGTGRDMMSIIRPENYQDINPAW